MSVEYWPIMGYGVEITPDMVDPEKAARFLGVEEFDPDMDMVNLMDALCGRPEGRWLCWAGAGEFGSWYLYCPAVMPWEAREERWEGVTAEGVREAIVRLLGPLLAEGYTVESLEVTEIYEVGCG